MKTAVELLTTGNFIKFPFSDMSTYDSSKHNLGPLLFKGTDTWTGTENFIGPNPIQVGRPMETSIATPAGFPHAIKIGKEEWAIVLADLTTAATTRKFLLYIYRSDTNTLTYRGAIINATAFGTAATIRGIRLQRSIHTTGTVSVSGTTVTGNGTNWVSRRVNAGSRIGFGSTDPDQITTWYDITPTAQITAETFTILSSPGTLSNVPYIIEDYSLIIAMTCATTSDGGGLRIIKGLSLSTACWSQTATATAIATATTVDNIRALYWLKNAATATANLVSAGLGLDDLSSDNLTQLCYVLDGSSTTAAVGVYNVKKALTLTSGYDTTAYQFVTGAPTVVGNVSQIHNCRLGTLNHGPGNGVKSLYFTTTTRMYRAAVSGITTGSTTFLNDIMLEIPPGGVGTLPATAAMSNLEIMDSMDRIAWISSCATAFRSYVTRYKTDSSQLDHLFLGDTKLVHGSTADATCYPYPNTSSTVMTTWAEQGMMFIVRHGTTALLNQLYTVPIACHWGYQNASPYNVYITPSISTPGCTRFWRLCVNECQYLGGDTLGVTPEGYKVYYRTTGITDNTGSWTLLPIDFDLSGVSSASAIQFKFEFKILSATCVPARIFGLYVIYESQDDIPSDLRWNMDDSSTTDGTVGFIQATSFAVLPTVMQIDYYRVDNNSNVLTQLSSETTNGVFEYHNGSTWVSGLGTNTVGMRRRFRPTAGLPNGVAVYPKLTIVS